MGGSCMGGGVGSGGVGGSGGMRISARLKRCYDAQRLASGGRTPPQTLRHVLCVSTTCHVPVTRVQYASVYQTSG